MTPGSMKRFFGRRNLELAAAEHVDDHNHSQNGRDKETDKAYGRITEDKRFYAGGNNH